MTTAVSKFTIARLPKRWLAYIRNTGPYMGDTELFGRLFTTVTNWAAPRGLMTDTTEAITVYHDDPYTTPVDRQRISVGYTVPEGTITTEGIELMEIPEGQYIIGNFEIYPTQYREAWREMEEFIRTERLRTTNLTFETYRNDPDTHPEGKHIVDLCMGIQ